MVDESTPNTRARAPGSSSGDDASLRYFVAWQRDRDRRARDLLVERYMPLARSLARRYVSARDPLDDLVQIASYGLIGAIDRFDPAKGASFTAFAVPTILGELRRYLRDYGWGLHVPRSAQERAIEVEQAIRELTAGARREPTIPDLAAHLGWSVETVLEAMQVSAGRRARSLDAPAGDSNPERPLADRLGGEDPGFAQVDERLSIASGLPRFAREVVRLRFVEDLTQSEIAARTGMSQMQVSRILRQSLEQLRGSITPPTPDAGSGEPVPG
jgi:RNA polymerase sigma-B factor